MKKVKKFKDELSKRDSKRVPKKTTGVKKTRLDPAKSRPPKYRHHFINEEE